jgi:hypothetical protein
VMMRIELVAYTLKDKSISSLNVKEKSRRL